ncbi:pyruvate dehydrogenase complex dihydrolipoamide acetyltransferase component (E2) [Aspergillus niger]|nr:pyruvate dehydrogenase complex dihydrolipoamide acetyltransferase component (E2) [Aspergillus niger]GKZ97358.1 pyruvate dehydrogenase complex dihydrolipoamide acetyltransferase component (E2) [Aspergillus niger]GLA01951.1 pyruvate dehydrogenase complex dihydrolipoamide acetyltransferase component (E2) [Aspergillus niger]
MSYAEAAAKGPKQSAEEVCLHRAPSVGGVYRDEAESTASLVDVDSPHVQAVDPDFLKQNVQTTTQAERIEREEEEREAYEERKAKSKAKAKAKAKASSVRSNAHNPVYLGNAVLLALTGAGLGYGAYRKHAAGQLSWELIGWCSGAVGAFGAVDYFVSKWLLQNKYPPK